MKDFNIFGSNDEGRELGSLAEIMQLLTHQIEEHGMDPKAGVQILFDMIRPGVTETSTDVKPIWTGAMYAYGFAEVCPSFVAMYINEMPWGVGFCLAVKPEFEFHALSKEAQLAVIRSFAIVLRAGGLEATVNDDNKITIKMPDGDEEDTVMSIDDIIGRFRMELDETDHLAARAKDEDPDDGRDPTRKWRPK